MFLSKHEYLETFLSSHDDGKIQYTNQTSKVGEKSTHKDDLMPYLFKLS